MIIGSSDLKIKGRYEGYEIIEMHLGDGLKDEMVVSLVF